MQVASSSLSICPSPPASTTLSSQQSHHRLLFGISGRVSPSGMGRLQPSKSGPVSPTREHVRNPCVGVVHLTESPTSSSCPSSPKSLLSPMSPLSAFSAFRSPSKVPRSRVPITPLSLTPLEGSSVGSSVPLSYTRPRFILASDSDHDHASGLHPDSSDESDRTSFSNEDLLPAIHHAGYSTATSGNEKAADAFRQHEDRESSETHAPAAQSQLQDAANIVEIPDSLHGLRRWHALMEIVQTEADYVRDLRKLVNVYLPRLRALPLQQHILSSVRELAHNAFDILWVHERFIRALQEASTHTEHSLSVDEAIERVACLFICEASSFDLYKLFCSSQPEILRLLCPEQSRPEWKDFEEQCARSDDIYGSVDSYEPGFQQSLLRSSISRPASPRLAASRTVSFETPSKADSPSPPAPQPMDSPIGTRSQSFDSLMAAARPAQPSSRLRFQDFLIKPIQRICKYPLMLEGLRNRVHGMSADIAVAEAVECMRGVAMRVDEARRERDAAEKSKLILERMEIHPLVTRTFVESLGPCMLAGSLDIVYHHHISMPAFQPVRIKYMGAFLYQGGYIILVKSGKGQKGPMYRVKYWFSLSPFDLVDIHEDDAFISHAFRLSYGDHHFEVSAACENEKDIWLRAINQSRRMQAHCIREPMSSLHSQPASPTSSDNHLSDIVALSPMPPSSSKVSIHEYTRSHSFLRGTTLNRPNIPNSVVRLFSVTDGPPPLLKRVPQTERDTLDRDLADVLSDLLVSLRSQAQMRDEVIFPPPKFIHPPQAMAMATTNRLMRRGSQIITQMSRSSIVNAVPIDLDEESVRPMPLSVRRKATARARGPILPALAASRLRDTGSEDSPTPQVFTREQCPPTSDTTPTSISEEAGLPGSSRVSSTSDHANSSQCHRRTRSLVGSFKGLVRRVTNKRHSLQQQISETAPTLLNTSIIVPESREESRKRASSAPSTPPHPLLSTILHPKSTIQPPSTQIHETIFQAVPTSAELPPSSQGSTGEKRATPVSSDSISTLKSGRSIGRMLCR